MIILSSVLQCWPSQAVQHWCYICFEVINSRDKLTTTTIGVLNFLDAALRMRILNGRCVFKDWSHIDLKGSRFEFPDALVQVVLKKSKSCVGLLNSSINMTWVLKLSLFVHIESKILDRFDFLQGPSVEWCRSQRWVPAWWWHERLDNSKDWTVSAECVLISAGHWHRP